MHSDPKSVQKWVAKIKKKKKPAITGRSAKEHLPRVQLSESASKDRQSPHRTYRTSQVVLLARDELITKTRREKSGVLSVPPYWR